MHMLERIARPLLTLNETAKKGTISARPREGCSVQEATEIIKSEGCPTCFISRDINAGQHAVCSGMDEEGCANISRKAGSGWQMITEILTITNCRPEE